MKIINTIAMSNLLVRSVVNAASANLLLADNIDEEKYRPTDEYVEFTTEGKLLQPKVNTWGLTYDAFASANPSIPDFNDGEWSVEFKFQTPTNWSSYGVPSGSVWNEAFYFQIDNPTNNWRSVDPGGNTWTNGQGSGTINARFWWDLRDSNNNHFTFENIWTQTTLDAPASNELGRFFREFDKLITLVVSRDSTGRVKLDGYANNIHDFSLKTINPYTFKNNAGYVPLAVYLNDHPLMVYDSVRVLTGSALPTPVPTSNPSDNPTSSPSFTPPQRLSWFIDRVSNGTIMDTDETAKMRVYYNMTHRNYSFTVLDPTCNETKPATGITIAQPSSNSSNADGFMNIAADLLFNATEIENNSDVWSGNEVAGNISFCLLASLWNDNHKNETTGKRITFDETLFLLEVDKTVDFNLTNIGIIRAGAESVEGPDIDYEANVTAYQCDASLTEITSPVPLSQKNNILSMCIHSESAIQVSSVVDLNLSQDATGNFPQYIYQAIDNGAAENIALVVQSRPEKNAEGFEVVRVQVVLAATLFTNPEPAPVNAFGTVSLDVAGPLNERKRHLLIDFDSLLPFDSVKNEKEAGRLLQGKDAANPFSLTAELSGNDSAGDTLTPVTTLYTMVGSGLLGSLVFA